MDILIERFNTVALKQTCPLETINMKIKYPLLRVSNIDYDDGRGARMVLSLKLSDNTRAVVHTAPIYKHLHPI